MGLIKAALGAAGGVMADQWKEYFYCESIPENVMAVKGLHRVSGRSSNYKGSENIISNGSVVAVADGQCMIIVDQGKVTELCAEPLAGDQIYTDVLGANCAGVYAILVSAIDNHTIWLRLRHVLELPVIFFAKGRNIQS